MKIRITILIMSVSILAFSSQQVQAKKTKKEKTEAQQDSFMISDSLAVILPTTIDTTYIPNFTPDPTKALWYSILVPGLGQIYNRKYWKLPLIYGGVLGLTYGITWNASKYSEYAQAYQDIMGNDPNSKSYMDFFPPGTPESSIDKEWLTKVLKNKKDYFRKNRDMCVLSILIVYGVGILDAYVDSSLHGFDMSPNLSVRVRPTIIQNSYNLKDMAFGLSCGVTF